MLMTSNLHAEPFEAFTRVAGVDKYSSSRAGAPATCEDDLYELERSHEVLQEQLGDYINLVNYFKSHTSQCSQGLERTILILGELQNAPAEEAPGCH
jgi:hypothetical protein